MIGAVTGDIVGSPYEFDEHNIKTTKFPLFIPFCRFTDDTVMTLAVQRALMRGYGDPEKTREEMILQMQTYGRKYPNAGYGARFYRWLNSSDPKPYGSYGNGSAMRVSGVAWVYDDLETVEKYAEISAQVTHDHPEGIKGAQAVAAAIFLARTGSTKQEIRNYIEEKYGYDLSQTCDEIRPDYHHIETCQDTVPQAFAAFLEGEDFETVLRLAVSLGGDSDTLTAIAGSMAEACYPIPDFIEEAALHFLTEDLKNITVRFRRFLREKGTIE